MQISLPLAVAAGLTAIAFAADPQSITIRFQAVVGDQKLECGQSYDGIGTTRSRITPRDFRFYVHNLRLIEPRSRDRGDR